MTVSNKIVVIGGTACGPKAAARARRCDPTAKITIIEQGDNLSTATCGLPYYVSGVIDSQNALMARAQDFFTDVMNMEVLTATRATAILTDAHRIQVTDLKNGHAADIEYDKLVMATGALPYIPNVDGVNLKGIFTMSKIRNFNHCGVYSVSFHPIFRSTKLSVEKNRRQSIFLLCGSNCSQCD